MRIVATSDTHYVPWGETQIPDGDVFIHAGDLMQDGYIDEWRSRVEWLAMLPHKVKIYVPGNHDFHMKLYPGPALQNLRNAGVMVIGLPGNSHYDSIVLPNCMTLLGLPYVTNLPRWAFNIEEKELFSYLRPKPYHDIIVSHMPVHGILDMASNGKHAGSKPYRQYFDTYPAPKVWISGHIHEGYGKILDKNGCDFYNVAMCNREYVHQNPPMVIDL
jgi:Icc-related predicted phosphoesterase